MAGPGSAGPIKSARVLYQSMAPATPKRRSPIQTIHFSGEICWVLTALMTLSDTIRLEFAGLVQVGKCSQSSCCCFNAAVAATLAARALPAAGASRQPRVPPGAPPRALARLLETSCMRGAVRCDRALEAVAMSTLPGKSRNISLPHSSDASPPT